MECGEQVDYGQRRVVWRGGDMRYTECPLPLLARLHIAYCFALASVVVRHRL